MAKKNKEEPQIEVKEQETPVTEETEETPTSQEEQAQPTPPAEKSELEEQKERYLRMAAEYDNFRKRTQKEKERMYADAQLAALKELLPSVDNLERAVAAATDSEKESGLYKGVEMTLKQLLEAFAHLGVAPLDTTPGTKFDPNLHEAIMHEPDGSGENVIAETFRKGYAKGDTIVRPALVKTRG